MNQDKKIQEGLNNGVECAAGGRVLKLGGDVWYVAPDKLDSMRGAKFFNNEDDANEYARKNGWKTNECKKSRWFSCFGKSDG